MSAPSESPFQYEPAPDHPGWFTWSLKDPTRYNSVVMGGLLVRRDGEAGVRLRLLPDRRHSNLHDNVHGGVTLGLIDIGLFAAAFVTVGPEVAGAVTLDLSTQFIGGGKIGEPLDVVGEVLKSTRRLVFVRGTVEQGDHLVAAFNGTLRKASGPRIDS